MEFAIVDIETTGGYAAGSGITEIAIVIHDGTSVIDRYETLINPQRPIPLSIQLLTGIDDRMVSDSPVFSDVAHKVFSLLSGRVFVAHSVNFDYSFVRHFLEASGYEFTANKLCTVRLSRKIKPGLPSYSLGRLCDSLHIPLKNRHRAGGDADATAELFSRLLEWDTDGAMSAMLKIKSKEQALPPNVPREDYDRLPECPGVYYFSDQAGKVIYVGKAKNIRKRVSSHFTGHNPNPQRQHFLRNIHSIRFERCGTELMALLLEAAEIKRLWPQYNRAMKRFEPKFGLYTYEDLNGYHRLVVGKHNKSQMAVHVFNSQVDGRNLLYKLVRDFGLCTELSMLGPCSAECFAFNEHVPPGSNCTDCKTCEEYNLLVQQALDHLKQNLPTFIIVDAGRKTGERSCIWVEKGRFHAMGYIDEYSDMQDIEDVKSSLTRYDGNDYMLHLIQNYADKYPYKVMKPSAEMQWSAEVQEDDTFFADY